MASEDEVDFGDDIPLHHQRPFGTGLYRKKISFVPAASGNLKATDDTAHPPGESIEDLYLSIVLSKKAIQESKLPPQPENGRATLEVCEVCKLPMTVDPKMSNSDNDRCSSTRAAPGHEASLVHQVYLPHFHPPSFIDRW